MSASSTGGGDAIAFSTDGASSTLTVPIDPATGTVYLGSWSTTDVTIDIVGYLARPTTTYTYEYGIGGIRTAKERTDSAGWRTEYTWTATGGLPLLLTETTGTRTTRIIYGPGGSPLYQTTSTGDLLYHHQDHQGSKSHLVGGRDDGGG